MKSLKIGTLFILWLGGLVPLFAQEGPLKDYAEATRDRKFCFYPSTLRMINVQGDSTFNEVINGIRKVLVYKLNASKVDEELRGVFDQYEDNGFEEYVRLFGMGNDVVLMGKERFGPDEYVGVAGTGGDFFAFYMKGDIRWDKIPAVLDRIQDNPVLSTLAPLNGNSEQVEIK